MSPAPAPRPVLIVIHKLGTAGMTQAVCDQAAMFTDAGHEVRILTLDGGIEQEGRAVALHSTGRLPAQVPVVNIHQDYRSSWLATRRRPTAAGHRLEGAGLLRSEEVDDISPCTRYFDRSGTYVAFHRPGTPTRPETVVHFEHRLPVAREFFDAEGRVFTVEEHTDGRVTRRFWLAPNGVAYLTQALDPAGGRNRGILVRSVRGRVHGRFPDLPRWHEAWLQRMVDSLPLAPIVLAESPSTIPKVAHLRPGSAIRIGMIHNNHFDPPYRVGAAVRADHAAAFAALADLEALVVLTEAQRRDLTERFGSAEKMRVVPNATALPEQVESSAGPTPSDPAGTKDPNLVVVVRRLAPPKAIDEAIHAFALVARRVPGARLEIHGTGPSRTDLEELTQRLGLQEVVQFMGHTPDPHAVMARAVATVLTSAQEAMPLTVLESQAVGTPVVAYDCPYGPADLIDDGRTGRLVAWGDRQGLADALVDYLRRPQDARRAGEAARGEILAHHSPAVVREHWEKLFAGLEPAGAEGRAPRLRGGRGPGRGAESRVGSDGDR